MFVPWWDHPKGLRLHRSLEVIDVGVGWTAFHPQIEFQLLLATTEPWCTHSSSSYPPTP